MNPKIERIETKCYKKSSRKPSDNYHVLRGPLGLLSLAEYQELVLLSKILDHLETTHQDEKKPSDENWEKILEVALSSWKKAEVSE